MRLPAESRVIECRVCLAQNRIRLEHAFRQPGAVRCGRCHKPLLLSRGETWRPKDPESPGAEYQHPLDREALAAVRELPGVDSLLKRLIENTYERYARLFYQSSFVKAGSGQLTSLHERFERAAACLAIRELPELYLYTDPTPNAHTGGVERPYVAVSTGLVEVMTDEELFAVMAHELAHWQCRHVLYKTATRLLVGAASAIAAATLGLGNLLVLPVRLALLRWDRCSELSADRGMLLATRDPELSLKVLMKLAGGAVRLRDELSLDRFIEQAEQARQAPEESVLDRIFSLLQTSFATHPFPLWRAAELWRWACDGPYLALLQDSAF
jgi:Zn-dependent protease with chaperone function